MKNPSGITLPVEESYKIEKEGKGIYVVKNAYAGEYDYFSTGLDLEIGVKVHISRGVRYRRGVSMGAHHRPLERESYPVIVSYQLERNEVASLAGGEDENI